MKTKRYISSFITLVSLVFFLQVSAFSQAAIKTEEGFLFIQNRPGKSFTVEITGKSVKPVESQSNPTFEVDGRIVQLVTVPLEQFTDQKLNAVEALAAHQKWEINYLSEAVFKQKLAFESEKISVGEQICLFWNIKRPIYNDEFDRDFFLTTVIGDLIFGISSPVEASIKTDDLKKQYSGFFATINVSDKPFDIEKLAGKIKDGKKGK